MDSDDHILEKLSVEANNLGQGDLMARIQDGWSISNRLLDPMSIHYGYLPSEGDLEVPDHLLSVAGLKWCGFSEEKAERLFGDSRMDPDHDYRLDIDLADYIKQFDLGREKDWHKAMNALGINNDLQSSIMDPKFDDICRTQPVQNCVQEFGLSNVLTLERLPDMPRRKIDQLQGKMAMPALIDDEDKRRF